MLRATVVGWSAPTGLGQMHRDLASADWVTKWLAPIHPLCGADPFDEKHPKRRLCRLEGDEDAYAWALQDVHALLFCERWVLPRAVLEKAWAQGITIGLIPMLEYFRPADWWIAKTSLFWAPTQAMLAVLQRQPPLAPTPPRLLQPRIAGGTWGVDLERFQFRERARAGLFLFCNGYGGTQRRKGIDVLLAAARQCPRARFLVRTQKPLKQRISRNVAVRTENALDAASIYREGDVYLAPSLFEGLGLSLYEAQACGLPVITTDGPPMNECQPLDRIAANPGTTRLNNQLVPTLVPSYQSLASLVRRYHGSDLREASRRARQHVETQHNLRTVLADLARHLV